MRLLGVGVSGLADWIQEDLFADVEPDVAPDVAPDTEPDTEPGVEPSEPVPVTSPGYRHRCRW